MEYKLPPLPDLLEKAITHFAQAVHYADTNGRIGAANNLRKEIEAYAIAAIEAQGVPDGYAGSLYVSGGEHCVTVEFESAARAQAYQNWIASAPPAPQASVVQQEPVAWKHDCAVLLTNDVELWIDACPHCGKPRIQPAQQGPVAWIRPSGKAMLEASGYCTVYASDGMSTHSTPLYPHPAQQAKPQPLTSDQKWDMWTAATIEQPSARGCYFRGVEDAEHAHRITKE